MERETVFFSWQSDIKAAANRTLIEQLGKEGSLNVELAIERDTQGLSGSGPL